MALVLDLTTRASPDAVLAALRSHAAHWRAPDAPSELRRAGVSNAELRVDGHRFAIHLESHGDAPSSEAVLRGEVRRRLGGGSRVRARAATAATERLVFALAAAPPAWLALSGHWWFAALVAAVGAGLAWRWRRRARSVRRDAHAAIRSLAEQLEAAVRAADRHATPAAT